MSMTEFPTSGVETYWWLPLALGFLISCLSSIGGLSGAFLLLPLQISFLGYTGPGVSPTNLVYNIVSIPSGVVRYWREGRMVWPLAWATMIGTLPGIFIGAFIRIKLLPDPASFKPFAGLVLLYIAVRLVLDIARIRPASGGHKEFSGQARVRPVEFNMRVTSYEFGDSTFRASTAGILLLSFLVGIVGGTYGIGGGAIIAPFFVAVFGLPVYTIAAAALFGTFVTSIAGVGFYWLLAVLGLGEGYNVSPDWMLGGLFGIGGAAGMYVGARLQRFLPSRLIKGILTILLLTVAVRYLAELW
jgi:uncharacterized membrane protein YfcA